MGAIDGIIRNKKLAWARSSRSFEAAVRRRDASAQQLAAAQAHHRQTSDYWRQLLTAEQPLCVQRLMAAAGEEWRSSSRVVASLELHRSDSVQAATLQAELARLQKDLEKLEERRVDRLRLRQNEQAAREARQLDEWVLNRRTGAMTHE